MLMKPKRLAECHQTLSSRVGSGHETSDVVVAAVNPVPWDENNTLLIKCFEYTLLLTSCLMEMLQKYLWQLC